MDSGGLREEIPVSGGICEGSGGELPRIRGVAGLPEYSTKVTRESFFGIPVPKIFRFGFIVTGFA